LILQFFLFISDVSPQHRKGFCDMNINSMLTTLNGRELSRELVIAAILKYGASNTQSSFNIVSAQLEKWCDKFFSAKDILFFKVKKKI
jgi:nuclear pore complex protein Nup155